MQIVSVRDKRIKELVENPEATKVRGLSELEIAKIKDMLSAIKAMTHPLALTVVTSWKAHELKPGKPNKWALRVTPNYRLTFMVNQQDQEVTLLDYEDYH